MAATRDDAGSEPLWTALDVARFLQVSRATVYNLVDRGALPLVRIGALLRFDPVQVRNFAQSGGGAGTVVKLKRDKR